MMDQQTQPFYEFLGFQLDARQRVLIRDGNLIALTPKAFDVLLFLVQNGGRIIEKDELMKAIWPESFVEEGNLSHNIFVLRKALGDDQNGNCLIQTIPRRGYKFVATVNQVDAQPPQNAVKEEDKSSQASVSAEYWNRHTPFRDLRAFEPEDSWLFFGRDSDTDELLPRLDRSPILVVIRDSGSGKSSLIRAGVIPALRQGHLPASGEPIHWRIALLRPTSSPFDYLSETNSQFLFAGDGFEPPLPFFRRAIFRFFRLLSKGTTHWPDRENCQYLCSSGTPSIYSGAAQSRKMPGIGPFCGKSENRSLSCRLAGGEGGIRTPDTLSGIAVFKTACFNRSHTSPREQVLCFRYCTMVFRSASRAAAHMLSFYRASASYKSRD
jgi:DNA-binding winged helix-turn-helix (wHTH) protein